MQYHRFFLLYMILRMQYRWIRHRFHRCMRHWSDHSECLRQDFQDVQPLVEWRTNRCGERLHDSEHPRLERLLFGVVRPCSSEAFVLPSNRRGCHLLHRFRFEQNTLLPCCTVLHARQRTTTEDQGRRIPWNDSTSVLFEHGLRECAE